MIILDIVNNEREIGKMYMIIIRRSYEKDKRYQNSKTKKLRQNIYLLKYKYILKDG